MHRYCISVISFAFVAISWLEGHAQQNPDFATYEEAFLNGDWETVVSMIDKDSSLLELGQNVLIAEAAYAMTNRNNEALRQNASFVGITDQRGMVEWAEELARKHSDNPAALYASGRVHAHQDDRQAAIGKFTRALSLDENYTLALIFRGGCYLDEATVGRVYASRDTISLALRDFEKAAKRKPAIALPYYMEGRTRGRMWGTQPLYGVEALDKCLAIDSAFGDAYLEKGRILLKAGETAKAIADFSQAIRWHAQPDFPLVMRAAATRHQGDNETALNDCNRALIQNSNQNAAYCLRSVIEYDLGMIAEATRDCISCLEAGWGLYYYDSARLVMAAVLQDSLVDTTSIWKVDTTSVDTTSAWPGSEAPTVAEPWCVEDELRLHAFFANTYESLDGTFYYREGRPKVLYGDGSLFLFQDTNRFEADTVRTATPIHIESGYTNVVSAGDDTSVDIPPFLRGVVVTTESTEALVFIFVKRHGLVHLFGEGTVELPSGTQKRFRPPETSDTAE